MSTQAHKQANTQTHAQRVEQTKDNIEAFGHYETARIYRKRGWAFDVTYYLMFGRMPRV